MVEFKEYNAIFKDLQNFASTNVSAFKKLLVDDRTSYAILEAYGDHEFVTGPSLIQYAKSIKNNVELDGFRKCHIRDATALCKYFSWLEDELVNKKNTSITEASAADYLEKLRSQLDLFVGLSFDTISSIGPNGAIIHYKPEHGTCATINTTEIYLCDSGAQFLDGTTDTTRIF
jgi:Xaa-Pro aminopeptidase